MSLNATDNAADRAVVPDVLHFDLPSIVGIGISSTRVVWLIDSPPAPESLFLLRLTPTAEMHFGEANRIYLT